MQGKKFVVDASVVLEWLNPEETRQKKEALRFYALLKNGDIAACAPVFLLIEIANVL